MKSQTSLPLDVREAIHANRKIDAIKLLRAQQDLGLKEAKHAVEAYIRENPHLVVEKTGSGITLSHLVLVILVLVVVYGLYRMTE